MVIMENSIGSLSNVSSMVSIEPTMPIVAPTVPLAETLLFSAILLGLLLVFTTHVFRSESKRLGPWPANKKNFLYWCLGVLLFLGVTAVISNSGLLTKTESPPPFLLVMLGLTGLNIWVCLGPLGGRLIASASWAGLIGFQVFRIPVEIWLHQLYELGIVPVQMTYVGYNFDILTGISAAGLGVWAWRRKVLPKALIWLWNILGLSLLLTIVAIAVMSTPTALRVFHNEPANTFVMFFPWFWLPAFFVQSALLGHLLVFRRLISKR
jgi:hypothetical protein